MIAWCFNEKRCWRRLRCNFQWTTWAKGRKRNSKNFRKWKWLRRHMSTNVVGEDEIDVAKVCTNLNNFSPSMKMSCCMSLHSDFALSPWKSLHAKAWLVKLTPISSCVSKGYICTIYYLSAFRVYYNSRMPRCLLYAVKVHDIPSRMWIGVSLVCWSWKSWAGQVMG